MSITIKLSNVNLRIGEHQLFKNLSFQIPFSDGIILILGPNGSGKSTLLKLICGIILPDSGDIEITGIKVDENITDESLRLLRRNVKVVLQEIDNQLITSRVLDEVLLGLLNIGYTRDEAIAVAEQFLKRFNLWEFKDYDPNELSYGQRARLLISALSAMRPKVLGLDEPEANLDPIGRLEFLKLLSELSDDLLVIWITHEVTLLNRFLSQGKLMEKLRGVIQISDRGVQVNLSDPRSSLEEFLRANLRANRSLEVISEKLLRKRLTT